MSHEDSTNRPAPGGEVTHAGGALAHDLTTNKIPPRMPLHEFVRGADLLAALVRGVRAMKARKPSDPLSWFYQAAIHGVPDVMIDAAAVADSGVRDVDRAKYWNQCPHFGKHSANFPPLAPRLHLLLREDSAGAHGRAALRLALLGLFQAGELPVPARVRHEEAGRGG